MGDELESEVASPPATKDVTSRLEVTKGVFKEGTSAVLEVVSSLVATRLSGLSPLVRT